MTPAEERSIIAERQAQQAKAEADRKANEAKVAAIEAQQRADKQREAEEQAQQNASWNTVYWGWGGGPRYWYRPVRPRPVQPIERGR
jgi:hypothetical protein